MKDSELLSRVASSDVIALSEIYDRHARSVYGYALLITRHPKDAERVLSKVFISLARAPERAATADELRIPLLAMTRPVALAIRGRKRRRWTLKPITRALDPEASKALLDEVKDLPGDAAADPILLAVEGLATDEIAAASGFHLQAGGARETRGAWLKLPPSLRSLVLLQSSDVIRPRFRYARWVAIWLVFAASVVVAWLTHMGSPVLPESRYLPPEGAMSPRRIEQMRQERPFADLMDAFHEEAPPE